MLTTLMPTVNFEEILIQDDFFLNHPIEMSEDDFAEQLDHYLNSLNSSVIEADLATAYSENR